MEMISRDESASEDDKAVFIVEGFPWRTDKVTNFLDKLDKAYAACKSGQASRQTKPRKEESQPNCLYLISPLGLFHGSCNDDRSDYIAIHTHIHCKGYL